MVDKKSTTDRGLQDVPICRLLNLDTKTVDTTKKEPEVKKEDIVVPMDRKGAKSICQIPLEHAIMELIGDKDFDGYLLTQFDCRIVKEIVGSKCQTAAIMFAHGYFFIRIIEDFFIKLTDSERVAVIKHEVAHFVMKHFARRNGRDPELFNIACLPGTECVQISGDLIEISKIKTGNWVYGSGGKLECVTRTMQCHYEGILYTIKAVGTIPIQVTDEHPLLVSTRKKVANIKLQPPKWKKAAALQGKVDYLLIPVPEASFSNKSLDLKEFFHKNSKSSRLAKGIKTRKIRLTKELAWILGLYVAEGSRVSNKDYGINFALHEDETKLHNRINKYFTSLGYCPYEKKNMGKSISVCISSTILGKAFSEWCGRGSSNKQIPSFILHNKDTSIINSFLDGYFTGDGCTTKDYQQVATTASKTLALQIQLLITRLDLFAPIGIIPARDRLLYGKTIHGKEQYTITWPAPKISTRNLNGKEIKCNSCRWKRIDNYFAVPITEIDVEPYNDIVYNIGTEDHTFLVNNIITHNCDMAINQQLAHMPSGGVTLPKGWKPNEAMEFYYDKLMSKVEKDPNGKPKGMPSQFDDVMDSAAGGKCDSESMADEIIRATVKAQIDSGNIPLDKLRGLHAGALEDYIDELTKPPMIDWRHALTRFAATLADQTTRRTLKRPDRRGLTPYGKKREYMPSLVVCIDTSGSVSDDMLSSFFSQINLLGKMLSEVNVVIADAQVHEHFVFKKGLEERLRKAGMGRGGTNFDPAIQYINKSLKNCDGAIYLTDGWCPVPDTKCRIPMIWIVTENESYEGKPRIMSPPDGVGGRR